MKIVLLNILIAFFEIIGGFGLAGMIFFLLEKGINPYAAIGLFLIGLFGAYFTGLFL